MATTTQQKYLPLEQFETKSSHWIVPLARLCFSLIFILSSFKHFTGDLVPYASSKNVPLATLVVPFSGLLALLGGLSILTGYRAKLGALFIIIFLVPVTLIMHDFWFVTDPQEAQTQMINFMKNLGLIGGAIFITQFGAGPTSFDHSQRR